MSRFIIIADDVWVLLPEKHFEYSLVHVQDKERVQNESFETEKDAIYYKDRYKVKYGFSKEFLKVKKIT